jgi:5-methylcytosine-specific restriction endonuclease McrA
MPSRLCFCGRTTPCVLHPRAPRHKTRRTPPPRGSAWRRVREVVLHRDGHRCRRCGSPATPFDPLHVHHLVPRSEGGSDDVSNLVTLCALCIRRWSASRTRPTRKRGGWSDPPVPAGRKRRKDEDRSRVPRVAFCCLGAVPPTSRGRQN